MILVWSPSATTPAFDSFDDDTTTLVEGFHQQYDVKYKGASILGTSVLKRSLGKYINIMKALKSSIPEKLQIRLAQPKLT